MGQNVDNARRALTRAAEGDPCQECGCTEQRACPGGCAWDTRALARGELVCTRCARPTPPIRRGGLSRESRDFLLQVLDFAAGPSPTAAFFGKLERAREELRGAPVSDAVSSPSAGAVSGSVNGGASDVTDRVREGEPRETDEKSLRRMLAFTHGCPLVALYGDDGELSCRDCRIDFRRDTPDEIDRKLVERGKARLEKELTEGEPRETDTVLVVMREASAWADATFTQSTVQSIAAHLEREARELRAAPTDPEEMADVAMLLGHLIHRTGCDIVAAMRAKLMKNRARQWGTPDAEGVVVHVPASAPREG